MKCHEVPGRDVSDISSFETPRSGRRTVEAVDGDGLVLSSARRQARATNRR